MMVQQYKTMDARRTSVWTGRHGNERAPDRAGPVEGAAPPARRSKKGKKKAALPQLNENDYVNVVPLPSEADLLERVRCSGHLLPEPGAHIG